MATIHLTKGAPKSTRLDAAGIRKRASTKGDVIVDVKPGEEVVSVNVGWTLEKFVALVTQVNGAKKASANGKNGSGKKNDRVKASASAKPKTAAPKKKVATKASSLKVKPKAKAKPAKKTSPKRKSGAKKKK